MHEPFRIAVLGDVHLCWNEADTEYFNNGSAYDLALFVGDVAAYSHRRALATHRSIARVQMPKLFIPGNHDGAHVVQLIAEVLGWPATSDLFHSLQRRRCAQLRKILGDDVLAGYTLHRYRRVGTDFALLTGRPHSMGGSRLAFRRYLRRDFGIGSLEDSTRRLKEMVDQCGADSLLFFSHNGPTGLGERRSDIWGCDFHPQEGDFGDPDLREAIDYAKASGKRVLAVVAGHMHHAVKGGGRRPWLVEEDGTLFVNAARVPRIFRENGRTLHHHVCIEVTGGAVRVEEKLVPVGGCQGPGVGSR
jgi:uncharacterized protein (TIGR04168 family)